MSLSNPHVALLFLAPGRLDTLRVNGRARLVRKAPFLHDLVVNGVRDWRCWSRSKRSSSTARGIDAVGGLAAGDVAGPASLPSTARLAKDVLEIRESLEELERYCSPEHYERKLYG